MMKTCVSCNKETSAGYLEFKCPGCLKHPLIRCVHCRATSKPYACVNCGFEGP